MRINRLSHLRTQHNDPSVNLEAKSPVNTLVTVPPALNIHLTNGYVVP